MTEDMIPDFNTTFYTVLVVSLPVLSTPTASKNFLRLNNTAYRIPMLGTPQKETKYFEILHFQACF